MRRQIVFRRSNKHRDKLEIFFVADLCERLCKIDFGGLNEASYILAVFGPEIGDIHEQPQLFILWHSSVECKGDNGLFRFTPSK